VAEVRDGPFARLPDEVARVCAQVRPYFEKDRRWDRDIEEFDEDCEEIVERIGQRIEFLGQALGH